MVISLWCSAIDEPNIEDAFEKLGDLLNVSTKVHDTVMSGVALFFVGVSTSKSYRVY